MKRVLETIGVFFLVMLLFGLVVLLCAAPILFVNHYNIPEPTDHIIVVSYYVCSLAALVTTAWYRNKYC